MLCHLVARLEPKVLDDIWNFVKDPTPNKYSGTKEHLLKIFVESENKKIKRLLTGIELGDMLPSQLLRKMRAFAGTDVSEKAMRTLWLDKMPDSVKGITIVSEEHLDKIAAIAHKIVEMTPKTINVAAVQKDTFNTMSFGPRNAPATFQRFITEVMCGLNFIFPRLNDVLIASSSEEEHKEHLKIVFERFQQLDSELIFPNQ
ncbi:uncharacterized protein TNCT_655291 [Trichonephila clavata]|uniref:Reverse transcriptase domain-containing protein n=1 Tax=Trichonephila clavata TaxID=2740835 RepID=A0A8X6L1T4_TRICU|nr:uncharacterized protein TNCT_655291 [Trichonephila clavata]